MAFISASGRYRPTLLNEGKLRAVQAIEEKIEEDCHNTVTGQDVTVERY
jgi:hypothetical protein